MRPVLTAFRHGAAILAGAGAALCAAGSLAQAQSAAEGNEGNEGTFIGDVPYVATPQDVVETMLDLAKVGPDDYVIDLGSGDGRLVVTAAQRGAEGFGVDLDPKRIAEAVENAKRASVSDRAQFFQRDLFETDFSRATVLTMYLLPDINLALRSKVLGLKPGTRVVSHDFDMGDWRPDERVRMHSKITGYESNAYLWVVPAPATGAWRWSDGGDALTLTVSQTYQEVALRLAGPQGPLGTGEAVLRGDMLAFKAYAAGMPARLYTGRIDGDGITGTVRDESGERPWRARRGAQ